MFNEATLKQLIKAAEYARGEITGIISDDELMHLNQGISGLKKLERGDAIASIWTIEDVFSLDSDDTTRLREVKEVEEARAVLKAAEHNHDANFGINWDVLRSHLDIVRAKQ